VDISHSIHHFTLNSTHIYYNQLTQNHYLLPSFTTFSALANMKAQLAKTTLAATANTPQPKGGACLVVFNDQNTPQPKGGKQDDDLASTSIKDW
jgi:hypothetical protein